MLAAVPFLFSTAASARAISMAELNQVRSEKRDDSYGLSPDLVSGLGQTINQLLGNDPSLNDTKIIEDLEGAINGELGVLHASLDQLNPLQIGNVLEKAVNKISNEIGDYDAKLTSDLDNTVGNLLGIL